MSYALNNYVDTGKDLSNIPANLHLTCESDTDTLYYVKSGEETKLYKKVLSTGVESLITTRSKKISRLLYDRTNSFIYFVDSNYDRTTSLVWKLDLSDDSISEVDSAEADIYDIFLIGTDVYISYFSASGFTVETGIIRPDGDVSLNWDTPGVGHAARINEGVTQPSVPDGTVNSNTETTDTDVYDTFSFGTIDLSGYDGGTITQIKVWAYYKNQSIPVIGGPRSRIWVKGNKTGTTGEIRLPFANNVFIWGSAVYSGLSLVQANLDDFEIRVRAEHLIPAESINWIDELYCEITFDGDFSNATIEIKNITDSTDVNQDVGALADRSSSLGQVVVVGTNAYFLFKWSDEDVELWKYDSGGGTIVQQLSSQTDFGTDTNLPPIPQWALTYDESNIISFVIGDGKEEISTIIADIANNIDNNDVLTFNGIDENGVSIAHHLWFNKDAGGSDPNTTANGIEVGITTGETAQQVSDLIQTAINNSRYFAAANGGGASTTITLQNLFNGSVTDIADVNSGLSVSVSTQGTANTYYYHTYSISADSYTKKGEHNIALMLNRNTNSSNNPPFNLEKAFHVSDDKIYQISNARGNLNLISVFNFAEVIRSIIEFYHIIGSIISYDLNELLGNNLYIIRIKSHFEIRKIITRMEN